MMPRVLVPKMYCMSCLSFQAKWIIRLPSMWRTASSVYKAQAMEARGNPYILDPCTRINGLGIKGYEAYRLWQHDECIRLGIAWLFGPRDAAEQPKCPAKQQYKPRQSSSHVALSMSYGKKTGYAGLFPTPEHGYHTFHSLIKHLQRLQRSASHPMLSHPCSR